MARDDFKPNWKVLKWVLVTLCSIVLVPLLAFAALADILVYDARPYYFLGPGLLILLIVSLRRHRSEKRNLELQELEGAKIWKTSSSKARSQVNDNRGTDNDPPQDLN
jgi:hypothetical protein